MLRPHAAHKGSFFMPALGAPTAKRAVWNAVLVSQQSALAWAAAQKEPKQCGFDPHTTDTPYEGYWCAELTLHAPSNQWRVLYVTNVVTLERWFNIYNVDHWIGWRRLSLAVTPEVHNFPLRTAIPISDVNTFAHKKMWFLLPEK